MISGATPVLLYSGIAVPAALLKIGDVLMGADGGQRVVSSLRNGSDFLYTVGQQGGGSYAVDQTQALSLKVAGTYECKSMGVLELIQRLQSGRRWPERGWRMDIESGASSLHALTIERVGRRTECFGFALSGYNLFLLEDGAVMQASER
jgi:hypothetical protein